MAGAYDVLQDPAWPDGYPASVAYVRRLFAGYRGDLALKADRVDSPTGGNFAGLDENGNLTDSGRKAADFAPSSDIQKAALSSEVQVLLGKAATALQDHQSLAAYVNGAEYVSSYSAQGYSGPAILLKHDSGVVAYVPAAAFVKDGMVSEVKVADGNLVVKFNTDAGFQDISIPITSIFNPANYYDKTAADAMFVAKETGKRLMTDAEGTKLSGVETGAKDNVVEKASASAFPPTGETGKIYVAKDTNKTYRWSGSQYTEIAKSVSVIAPSTNPTDDGKAADAKATGDALAGKRGVMDLGVRGAPTIAAGAAVGKFFIDGVECTFDSSRSSWKIGDDYEIDIFDPSTYRFIDYTDPSGEPPEYPIMMFALSAASGYAATVLGHEVVGYGGDALAKTSQLPTTPADIGAQPAGNYLTQHQQLTTVYGGNGEPFSDWICSGIPQGATDIELPIRELDGRWAAQFVYDGNTYFGAIYADENVTRLDLEFDSTTPDTPRFNVTATRFENPIGYQLGSQVGKPLQPVGNYAPASALRYALNAITPTIATTAALPDSAFPITFQDTDTGDSYSLSAADVEHLALEPDEYPGVSYELAVRSTSQTVAFYRADGTFIVSGGHVSDLAFNGSSTSPDLVVSTVVSATLADRAVNQVALAAGTTSLALALPSAVEGKSRDFFVCVDNTETGAAAATAAIAGATLVDASGASVALSIPAGASVVWRFTEKKAGTTSPSAADPVFVVTGANETAAIAGKYAKPSGGIPASDMASAVQTSLGKADTAVQPAALTAKADSEAIAPAYDSTAAYSAGDVVTHEGKRYACNTAIASGGETWTAAHWDEESVQTAIGNIDVSSQVAGKLNSTSAAPAFSSSATYAVGDHVTCNGVLYECVVAKSAASATTPDNDIYDASTATTNHWKVTDMTTPDATLDILADGTLRVSSPSGTLWRQGYNLASESSATMTCNSVKPFAFAATMVTAFSDATAYEANNRVAYNGKVYKFTAAHSAGAWDSTAVMEDPDTQALALPTAAAGKVGDFGLDVDNSANTVETMVSLTGLDDTFSVVVPKGESLVDMLTFAGGELAVLYFTLTAFRVNNLPTWQVLKQVVENGGATS